MSTIVVAKKDKLACIAADSQTSFGDTKLPAEYDDSSDKIIYHQGNYLGVVGSAAHQIVLESALQSTPQVELHGKRMIFETFRRLHPVLKENYFLNPGVDEDDTYESSRIDCLILNESGIYGVFALREVFEYTRFWATGSGADFALGAMEAIYKTSASAVDIARAGVEAAAKFDSGTSLPMSLYSISTEYSQAEDSLHI